MLATDSELDRKPAILQQALQQFVVFKAVLNYENSFSRADMAGVGQQRCRGHWANPMPPLSLQCLGKQTDALCTKGRKLLAWSDSATFGVILLCALLNQKKVIRAPRPQRSSR